MTREDVKKIGVTTVPNIGLEYIWYEIYIKKIDEIFDDFESRICENCNGYDSGYCNKKNSVETIDGLGVIAFIEVSKDFGCNKFARKQQ
jgi:hypothetical protein